MPPPPITASAMTGAITREITRSGAKTSPVGGTETFTRTIAGTKHVAAFIALVGDGAKAVPENIEEETPPMLVLVARAVFRPDIVRIKAVGNPVPVVIGRQVVEPVPVFVDELANPVSFPGPVAGISSRVSILRHGT